jgi:UDP-N-acetylglucosamine/UDP-N-acetylgalactosamine diphosphorylase
MKDELLVLLARHGQEHLLGFWDQIDRAQRQSLARQIRAIDFALVQRLYQCRDNQSDFRQLAGRASSPPAFRLPPAQNRFKQQQACQRGRQALAAGQLGVILVAGGQGTRLGFPHPKGMFPIGPVSGRSLFQVHVEKIIARARRHGVSIPLCVMTSPTTHDETAEFFARHGRFGLAAEDLTIFCQETMPAVDAATGKILLERPDSVATSPNGHGGMLAALAESGALDQIARRGIRDLFYFQVDNPLVDVCAAEFIGYHLLSGSELSTQVIAKRGPFDKVGNVVQVDEKLMVIEYSDLPDDVAQRRQPDGSLSIWAGSIAVHVMATAMLRRLADRADALPFHLARKSVAYVDAGGRTVEPAGPNAIKFERFIFDLMPWAANAIVVEVDPTEGFAPLKNASGSEDDTPEAVKAQMAAQHRRWLRQAGAQVADDVDVEISPLYALDAQELAEKIEPGTRVTQPTFFC